MKIYLLTFTLYLINLSFAYSAVEILKTDPGFWYPNNKKELTSVISKYLKNSGIKNNQFTNKIIVPHAGYRFSGKIAAKAFSTVKNNKYKRIIVIGPSHRRFLQNQIALPESKFYETILDRSKIDTGLVKKLLKSPLFTKTNFYFHKEHSIDNEIPFIQTLFKGIPILPMVMGHFDKNKLKKLSTFLSKYITDDTLLVISSDFTHYGKHFNYVPFKKDIAANLLTIDSYVGKLITTKNFEGFWNFKAKVDNKICGFMPIALLLTLLKNNKNGTVVEYKTSGEITEDFKNSVSYMTITFQRRASMDSATTKLIPFSDEDKKYLLKFSRETLEDYVKNGKKNNISDIKIDVTDAMNQLGGGFVTLHKNHQLRGCIGEIFPTRDVLSVIQDRTIDAAVNDPRFPPVTESELKDIKIEISVLTPPIQANSYEDIILGKHGIVLKNGINRAVFLPQVATEQKWDLDTTLTQLSLKAGLSGKSWKDKETKFELFEAIVFNEGK